MGTHDERRVRTFFADETVIPVIRVVGVAESSVRVLELQELVAVLARVPCTAEVSVCEGRKHVERVSTY